MTKNILEIRNFKSIKYLQIGCKNINVFIGKPNTGKSNILEAIGLFSLPYGNISDFIRFEKFKNIFHDQDLDRDIAVTVDDQFCKINCNLSQVEMPFDVRAKGTSFSFHLGFDHNGKSQAKGPAFGNLPFKYYRFQQLDSFPKKEFEFLLPPKGENLTAILQGHQNLKEQVEDIFITSGLEMMIDPKENQIKALKKVERTAVLYPYSMVAESVRKVIFYLLAIETNRQSVLVFDDPASDIYPPYTKYLADRIMADENNQYFIATHNPYLLEGLLKSTKIENVGIFITDLKAGETRVTPLLRDEIDMLMKMNSRVFFNIDKFIPPDEMESSDIISY